MEQITPRTPAAQYLRMSTDHQQYSMQNQAAAIQNWADEHRFMIVKTYEDAGKSGLVLNRREGLRQLLRDVVSGEISFKAILVFDVSRWGRFQDIDEAAHYEFLCRSAGIHIHYCAESFADDASLASMIMKALKRMMAGEYSRELSAKVYAGASRLAQLGFKQGGIAGYGYRRMLVSPYREPKVILLPGQRKSIQEDRVMLVPGPQEEVQCIREICRLFVDERKMPKNIAAELNARGYKYEGVLRNQWYPQAVNRVLRNAKYTGRCIYGRSSGKLHTPKISLPPNLWIVKEGAWQPLIDQSTFDRAQQRFREQTHYKNDDELLGLLKKLWSTQGTISEKLLNGAKYLPSLAPFAARFGSLSEACARIGFHTRRTEAVLARRRTLGLRHDLVQQIVTNATAKIALVQRDGHFRPRLRMPDHTLVSVEVLRCFRNKNGQLPNSSRSRKLAPGTVNLRLGAVRRLAYEAADCGLLSPDLAEGIRRVTGVKKIGVRLGNWLTAEQSQTLWQAPNGERLKEKRDRALLAVLLACGLRRHEAVELNFGHIQQREEHWAIVDLKGKAGHIRTIPMPAWVKNVLDQWLQAANITSGKLFRRVHKMGRTWGERLTEKAVWHVVREYATKAGIDKLAPHDLRRTCARLCHAAGGELEQLQFLLGHISIQTTERYLGCKQRIQGAVNDKIGIEPSG